MVLVDYHYLIGCSLYYNRYAVPKYDISAKIQILEEKGASSELAVFKDLDFLGGKLYEVEDEIEVLIQGLILLRS
ncbi:hypothetical protein Q2T40_03120 [Winogradskyella maritima]|nr:hypothetical protein [Winogradskyella maritima]